METLKRQNKFRDPVHGFIYVSDLEKEIIASPAFQRLRNIKQLALTHYVFHGAEHTRFGHSLGVMHIATRAFQSAISKGQYDFSADSNEHEKTVQWLEQILRITALTHDLGHAPFSHASETLFPAKPKQAGDTKPKYYEHEDFTEFIILNTEIANIINKIGNNFVEAYGDDFNITPQLICDIYRGKNPGKNSIFTFIKTFLDSELDCDKMDYLIRDALYCGVSYGKYDLERLLSCLTILKKDGRPAPFLGIESGGIQAFEEFVLARYFMFVQVYFHRTRRFFDMILVDALNEILPKQEFKEPNGDIKTTNSLPLDVNEYLEWDDIRVMNLMRKKASQSKRITASKIIIERIPWTCVYSTKTHPKDDGQQLFKTIQSALKNKLGKGFNGHFLVDTLADKSPYKIVPQKRYIDDEEVIAIVDKHTGRRSTISDESHIINNLTERINIQRIYADEIYGEKARKIVSSYINDTGEDD